MISYRSGIAWLAPGVLAIGAAIGALTLVLTFLDGGPVWFIVLVLGVIAWQAFNMIVRQARSIVVVNGTLLWTSWLTRREVALKDVVRLSLASRGTVQVIECRDGRRLRIAVAQGYRPFIERLARNYPDLQIEMGTYSRFVEHVRLLKPPPDDQPPRSSGTPET